MKIAGATLNQTPLDWKGNSENIIHALEEARKEQIDLICFPELSICGYGCEDMFLSNWLWKKCFDILIEKILPNTKNIACAVGLPVKHEDNLYNCVAFIQNGELLHIIPKQNLANDGVHYEPRWFTPWKYSQQSNIHWKGKDYLMGDYIIEFANYKIGFEICEDAWRVDRPACRFMEKEVNLILNPSASHFAIGKSIIRQELVISSSKQYKCTYIYANLLGNEAGRMIYDGEVMIAKEGTLILKNQLLSFHDFQICCWDTNDETKEAELYEARSNEEFQHAVALALFDYLRKSKSNGFVLSLSGGADSSTCAILVAEMVRLGLKELGLARFLEKIHKKEWLNEITKNQQPEQFITHKLLTTAYQSTKNSGHNTYESARKLAKEIGAVFYHWGIDDEVETYTKKIEQSLNRQLSWERDDIALQNIQARARSPIIWMLANINNALLITTSNRSEGDVGYTTMDGDTSGSIAPIAAIDKFFIIQWLKWAENTLNYKSLGYVNKLQPSAELRPKGENQTDETDLMPYQLLLSIEKLAIEEKLSPVEVYEKLKEITPHEERNLKEAIIKFFKLWARNQWKRERLAPSFHLDTFNVDPKTWCRFPILSSGFQEELSILEKWN
ncbi:NAD(+) synthase [Marivirga sp. S37H4]|uniref:Glutamine-dependent NAD(+) synthetase n=1 Tax=Marivirga aurantiaca TaxID=2802615 RepID=A0A934WWZ5_9BACT|nr:NAD(+) synthase [Marivirga aurantiaca]MBK6264653.1 NAD(+) synthase [Marivirga aurantiaca]